MPKLKFLNANGDFVLTDADQAAETYFPLANEGGIISSITPRLAGDCKTGQDTFLLAACSEQTLHESRATRNFWLQFADGTLWSAADGYYLIAYGLTLLLLTVGSTRLPRKVWDRLPERARDLLGPLLMAAGLVICTAYLVDGSYNPFLYFRF